MLETFKITAISAVPNTVKKTTSYAINVRHEGGELAVWRTESQFRADIKRSGFTMPLERLNMNNLVNGDISGDISLVKKGDKYTVEVVDENDQVTVEEREYKEDGLQVGDGFLSISLSLNAQIAMEVAATLAASNNF